MLAVKLGSVLALVAAFSFAPVPLVAETTHPTIAVLPMAAADPNVPYGLLPTPAELKIMTTEVGAGLRSRGVSVIRIDRVAPAVSAAGFDQTAPIRACVVADCARRIGRAVGADTVVMGSVTRAMAVIWGTDFSIVDVRTGKVTSEMNVGYKGDVQAMERGDWDAGGCLARLIQKKKACASDPGW